MSLLEFTKANSKEEEAFPVLYSTGNKIDSFHYARTALEIVDRSKDTNAFFGKPMHVQGISLPNVDIHIVKEDLIPTRPLMIPYTKSKYKSELLQKWDGTVQKVSGEEITVVLRDLSDLGAASEEVEISSPEITTISIDSIPDEDHHLVKPGAIFIWTILYRTSKNGQKSLVSDIRFRRLPVWTKSEIKKAESLASKIKSFLLNDSVRKT